ncbi:MAG: DUF998 domain-containing protein [Candidatus Heimdallarchaeota archaeon]|nr:MAG: DUF998 domain-containing protein [Candidatus Heimdallarchaeota archaeon]
MLERPYRFDFNPLRWPKVSIVGFVGITIYCIFTLISFSFFPRNFNPINNNLSELGDFYDNPNGAIFYNVGMVLTGIASIFFYIGLYEWFMKKKKSPTLVVGLAIGIINALAIIMAGIFSETQETYSQHVFWSILIFLSFFPILILVNKSILTFPDFNKIVAYYGFGVSLIDLSFLVFLVLTGVEANFPFIEWLSVFSYISWIGVLAYYILRFNVLDIKRF